MTNQAGWDRTLSKIKLGALIGLPSWPAERVNSEFAGAKTFGSAIHWKNSARNPVSILKAEETATNGIRPLKPRTIHGSDAQISSGNWAKVLLVHDQDGTLEQPLFAVVFELTRSPGSRMGSGSRLTTSMQQVKQLPVSMEPSTAAVMLAVSHILPAYVAGPNVMGKKLQFLSR